MGVGGGEPRCLKQSPSPSLPDLTVMNVKLYFVFFFFFFFFFFFVVVVVFVVVFFHGVLRPQKPCGLSGTGEERDR